MDPGRALAVLGARLRWPLVVLALGGLAFLAVDRARRSLEDAPAKAARGVADAAGALAERFRSGRITTTFTASLPRPTGEGVLLELASFEATETFRRRDERAVLFDLLPLGTTVSEIRVPVTYRYHLRLDDPWHLDVRGPVCVVRAPRIRATLPPAIHTDRMERRSESAWLRFDADAQMEALERGLSPALSARAGAPQTLGLVREQCRRRTAEFVRDWLLREDHWRDGRFSAVTVSFADEPEPGPVDRPPTLVRPAG